MRAVVLVPRRRGQADRDRLWEWCRSWWEQAQPDLPIYEGHHDDGLFNRSAAVNRAAKAAGTWDVAVIIDADVICDPLRVRSGIELARRTGGAVLPFRERVDLNFAGSEKVRAGFAGDWRGLVMRRWPDNVSSVVIVPRRLWDTIGGMDEGFIGWGWEDLAFHAALETFGPPVVRMPGEAWHFWHDKAEEGRHGQPSMHANRARAGRYLRARGDRKAMSAIRTLPPRVPPAVTTPTGIPRIIHRVVPRRINPRAEAFWERTEQLHPGWTLRTWRDPIDPAAFPITSPHWGRAANGAQLAGLIRLEALWNEGGIYVDEDVEPYRPFDPLLPLSAFAAWEDAACVPDAVLGAVPRHPAIRECIDLALIRLEVGTWESGPGVTTLVLPYRDDVLLLPPGSFYGVHYRDPQRAEKMARGVSNEQPWAFVLHHYWFSWDPKKQPAPPVRERVPA